MESRVVGQIVAGMNLFSALKIYKKPNLHSQRFSDTTPNFSSNYVGEQKIIFSVLVYN